MRRLPKCPLANYQELHKRKVDSSSARGIAEPLYLTQPLRHCICVFFAAALSASNSLWLRTWCWSKLRGIATKYMHTHLMAERAIKFESFLPHQSQERYSYVQNIVLVLLRDDSFHGTWFFDDINEEMMRPLLDCRFRWMHEARAKSLPTRINIKRLCSHVLVISRDRSFGHGLGLISSAGPTM